MGKKYRTLGISWPDDDLLSAARRRADRLGLSFSSYVCRLVRDDLDRGGDMVLKDREPPPYGRKNPKGKESGE